MDTASASLENKPLKGTEEPLVDAFPGSGCDQLARVIKTRQQTHVSWWHVWNTLSSLANNSINFSMLYFVTWILQQILDDNYFFPWSLTCFMNSSSSSTNDSRALATSFLNLHRNETWSIACRYFPKKMLIAVGFMVHQSYLSLSSSVKMNLSLNLDSALFSHQNLWVFFLCSGLKPNTV